MKNVFLFLMSFFSIVSLAQTEEEKKQAKFLAYTAIQKMDSGYVDESITLLKKSQKLDPDNMDYPYELGYASYLKKNYKMTVKYLEPLTKHKDRTDRVFQMLGNAYDMQGKTDKALEAYEKGKKAFPESGKFYHEIGVVYVNSNRLNDAIVSWEQGVKVDPYYGSNYYRLANALSSTDELIWVIFYSEMFILIEPSSSRTKEVSKLLMQAYQKSYVVDGSKAEIKLTKNGFKIFLDEKGMKEKNIEESLRIPFEGQYATSYSIGASINYAAGVTSSSIVKTTDMTLSAWFDEKGGSKDYQNVLLNYQRAIKKAGFIEPYMRWSLSYGDSESWSLWLEEEDNLNAFKQFANWYKLNPFKIDESVGFTRLDYLR